MDVWMYVCMYVCMGGVRYLAEEISERPHRGIDDLVVYHGSNEWGLHIFVMNGRYREDLEFLAFSPFQERRRELLAELLTTCTSHFVAFVHPDYFLLHQKGSENTNTHQITR